MKQKVITVSIAVGLIIILSIYLVLSNRNSDSDKQSESSKTTVNTNTEGQLTNESTSDSLYNVSSSDSSLGSALDIDDETDYVIANLTNAISSIDENSGINTKISLVINNKTLEIPFVGQDLEDLGYVDSNTEQIYGFCESYGDFRNSSTNTIELGYINNSENSLDRNNCIISNLVSTGSNMMKVRFIQYDKNDEQCENQLIKQGETRDALLGELKKLSANDSNLVVSDKEVTGGWTETVTLKQIASVDESENLFGSYSLTTDECNKQLRDEIRTIEIHFEGNDEEGLHTIKVFYNAVNKDTVSYNYVISH